MNYFRNALKNRNDKTREMKSNNSLESLSPHFEYVIYQFPIPLKIEDYLHV